VTTSFAHNFPIWWAATVCKQFLCAVEIKASATPFYPSVTIQTLNPSTCHRTLSPDYKEMIGQIQANQDNNLYFTVSPKKNFFTNYLSFPCFDLPCFCLACFLFVYFSINPHNNLFLSINTKHFQWSQYQSYQRCARTGFKAPQSALEKAPSNVQHASWYW
jgi:hypothetical protein